MDCSQLYSSVYRIFQARILGWVAISFSRGSSWHRNWIRMNQWILHPWATREAPYLDIVPYSWRDWFLFLILEKCFNSGTTGQRAFSNSSTVSISYHQLSQVACPLTSWECTPTASRVDSSWLSFYVPRENPMQDNRKSVESILRNLSWILLFSLYTFIKRRRL